jgi:hypothetical protein
MSQENLDLVMRAMEAVLKRPKPDFETMRYVHHVPQHDAADRLTALLKSRTAGSVGCTTGASPGDAGSASASETAQEQRIRGLRTRARTWRPRTSSPGMVVMSRAGLSVTRLSQACRRGSSAPPVTAPPASSWPVRLQRVCSEVCSSPPIHSVDRGTVAVMRESGRGVGQNGPVRARVADI